MMGNFTSVKLLGGHIRPPLTRLFALCCFRLTTGWFSCELTEQAELHAFWEGGATANNFSPIELRRHENLKWEGFFKIFELGRVVLLVSDSKNILKFLGQHASGQPRLPSAFTFMPVPRSLTHAHFNLPLWNTARTSWRMWSTLQHFFFQCTVERSVLLGQNMKV